MISWRTYFFAFLILCCTSHSILAAQQDSLEEIRVVADRMEAETVGQKVTFSGHVKATQKDVVIYAQEMTLYYNRDEDEKEKGLERAELTGDVRILQQERMATANKGVFLNLERKIILSGLAEVHQAGNVVKGDEIVYFIDEERSIVTSDSDSRVQAVINPKGDAR
jgi:lipopolysaccharide export system protein LptA